MSKLACVKVGRDVFRSVKRAMELGEWKKYVRGRKLVLKVNVVWDKVYPGCTTTPMVIEGVLRTILESKKFRPGDIVIADTDTAAIVRAEVSFRIQGIEKMAQKYGVKVVNLSHTEFEEVPFPGGSVLKSLKISRVLLDADCIITMPVLKTHSFSGMTGSLKNQWGCIHDMRHNYHTVLSRAIVDVNLFFADKIKFALMDGLFGMEGQGPKTGRPRRVGYVLAGSDRVAMDTEAARIMGLDPGGIRHILYSEQAGLGGRKYEIVGDKLPRFQFARADTSNIVMKTEMALRHIGPWSEKLMFSQYSPFYHGLRWSAKIYYDIWYRWVGIKYVREMLETDFGRMWRAYLSREIKESLV